MKYRIYKIKALDRKTNKLEWSYSQFEIDIPESYSLEMKWAFIQGYIRGTYDIDQDKQVTFEAYQYQPLPDDVFKDYDKDENH